jgi:hypothetical protein
MHLLHALDLLIERGLGGDPMALAILVVIAIALGVGLVDDLLADKKKDSSASKRDDLE